MTRRACPGSRSRLAASPGRPSRPGGDSDSDLNLMHDDHASPARKLPVPRGLVTRALRRRLPVAARAPASSLAACRVRVATVLRLRLRAARSPSQAQCGTESESAGVTVRPWARPPGHRAAAATAGAPGGRGGGY